MKSAITTSVIVTFLTVACAGTKNAAYTQGQVASAGKVVNLTSNRTIKPSDIVVPNGYQIQAVAKGLSYPVDITFDDKGNAFIAEAGGHTYGTKPASAPDARILQLMPDGSYKVVYDKVVPMDSIKQHESSANMPEGLIPPVTGITYYQGKLYIAHRSRYSTYDLQTGEFKTIINGLNSWGEFLNAKPVFHNGKMVFFLSTQGNSGVIEEHWVNVIDIFGKLNAYEIPGENVTLTGQNYQVPVSSMSNENKEKLPGSPKDSVLTGVYVPLGQQTKEGQVIKGEKMCNGAFFQCNPDGSNIERIAWGLRSSFGYRYSPDGRLITTMNSANPMPPRGIYFDYEPVYEVVQDEWYGWPDYFSGIPITDKRFEYKEEHRQFVLTSETHQQLLKGKTQPRQPLMKLPVHSAAEGMVFGNGTMGVAANDILVAEFGAIVPIFKGKDYHPQLPPGIPDEQHAPEGVKYNWPGFKVQHVNLQSGNLSRFDL